MDAALLSSLAAATRLNVQAAGALAQKAISLGSNDNVTAMVICLQQTLRGWDAPAGDVQAVESQAADGEQPEGQVV